MNLYPKFFYALVAALCINGASLAEETPNTYALSTAQMSSDYAVFYSKPTFSRLGVALGLGAASAQWLDKGISADFQKYHRNARTDEFSKTAKAFGEWTYLLPVAAAAATLDASGEWGMGQWGNKTFRALMVGTPALLAGQLATGASRPSENKPHAAQWRPFQDNNGVSGHAFVGALPFLTLADLHAHNPWVYYPSVLASWATPLSRLNDNQHYFSQIVLGWYFAHQATKAVSETTPRQTAYFAPYVDRQTLGLMYTRALP